MRPLPAAVKRYWEGRPSGEILRGLLCLVGSITLGLFLPHGYNPLEGYDFDLLTRTLSEEDTYSDDIVLVTIDGDDYNDLFGRKSPLDTEQVRKLIQAILGFEPKALGIDLVTDHWAAETRQGFVPGTTRMVWAGTGNEVRDTSGRTEVCFAAPLFQPDPDGTIRGQAWKASTSDRVRLPSFALMLSLAREDGGWPGGECEVDGITRTVDGDSGRIRFTGKSHRFRRFQASTVLADAALRDAPIREELAGKVVILGGTFVEARDRYVTPVGAKDGVEILGHAVLSIDHEITEWSEWRLVLLELAVGIPVVVGLALFRLPGPLAAIVASLAPLGLGLVVSYLAFQYLGSFVSVAVDFIGIPAKHFGEDWFDRLLHPEKEA